MRKSFILHKDSLCILDELSDEEAGQLFKAIAAYQNGEDVNLQPILRIAFATFRNQFVRDEIKYQEVSETRRLSGSKGGKQKVANASKSKQKLANLADSDSKNDSDSVSNSEKEKKISSLISFEKHKEDLISQAKDKYPNKNVAAAFLDMLEYCQISGKRYADYKLAFFRWVREDKFDKYQQAAATIVKETLFAD